MKHVRTFEDNIERNYTIICDGKSGLAVSIIKKEPEYNDYPFRYVARLADENYIIRRYTLKEAQDAIPKAIKQFNEDLNFRVILISDLDVLLNVNKYNL